MIAKLDHRMSLAISSWTARTRGVKTIAVLLATWLIWFLGALALAAAFTSFERLKYFVGALIIGVALNLLLGKIKERARPYDTHSYKALISTWWLGGSFPSDHAMLAGVCASLLFPLGGPWVWASLLLAGLVGLGRILVGVHYVSDVIIGFAVAGVTMLIMLQLTPIL